MLNPDPSLPPQTPPLGPRSALVSSFCDWLNGKGAVYAVMNNYEDLPWVIPSDVDFAIAPAFFARLDTHIAEFAGLEGAEIIQKLWHGNRKCAYILAVGPAGAREFVQLDFFVAFSTRDCPRLIPFEELVKGRRSLRNFYTPRPEVELLFTTMRRFFKNDWEAKHCARLAELHERIDAQDWLPARYEWMRPTITAAMEGELAQVRARRGGDWARLKQTARRSLSLKSKFGNYAVQARRVLIRLRNETGHLAVLNAPAAFDAGTRASLDLVFHRWLVLDEAALSGLTFPKRWALIAKLWLLKRRKGLTFLQAGEDAPEGAALARRLAGLGMVDESLDFAGRPAGPQIAAPCVNISTEAEAIQAIVSRQSVKTARAMARGGTQTSGRAS